jgi:hypothetical protein
MSRKPNPVPLPDHATPEAIDKRKARALARVLGTKKKEDGE